MSRRRGRTLSFISVLESLMPSSSRSLGRLSSTSPTTWAKSLYSGSKMNSTKLRCAELCGGFLVNFRVLLLK
uniref:Putative secreted protein n=1 Tax=Ixodes ricinus TaxID=34613 RepID=A0A6B0U0M8_IXORI